MAEPKRFDVSLDVGTGRDRSPAAPRREDPFLLLVIGDFSGREASGADARPLAERRPVTVDRDDIDEVLARFAPGARIERSDGVTVELTFREMEDFHPDRIFRRAPFFQALREARQRAREPRGGQGLIGALLGEPVAAAPRPAPASPDADTGAAADAVLERIIDGPSSRGRPADPLQAFLRGIVAPHIVPGRDPAREAILAELDAGTVRVLRDVLHAPAFRRLERLWRSVDFLVRRTETSSSLRILLLDATTTELRSDIAANEAGEESAFARALREAAPADTGIAAIVTDMTFEPDAEDIALLRGLARMAAGHGAVLLAGASPLLAGLTRGFAVMPDSRDVQPWQDDAWHAFRRSPDATGVGLAMPRFLLRIPYGEDGEECESLEFEENDGPPGHEDYLWGNPAFACAVLLGQEFAASGWSMRPGMHRDIAGLPLHSFRGPDGPELKPCAECTMSDGLADALMETGLMVLASVKHGDVARLVRFQSIASPLTALRGPWSRSV